MSFRPAFNGNSNLLNKTMKNIIIALAALTTTLTAQVKVGASFPDLSSHRVSGAPSTKGKVVLYDFWASWCVPCKKSFPGYDKLHRKYADKGFMVVAVGTDKKKKDSDRFLKNLRVSFPIAYDRTQSLVSKVRPKTMPTAYLVGKDGKVIHIHNGYKRGTIKTLEKYIKKALN